MKTENQISQSLEVLSRITILISFIIMFNSCKDVGVDFNETLPNPIVTSEELKIYGLVLEEINTDNLIIVADTTMIITADGGYDFAYNYLINFSPTLHKETYDAYSNPLNKKRILRKLPVVNKHKLALLSQHQYIFNEPGVHGVVRFSNIGFNRSKTQALLFYTDFRFALDGSGCHVLLKKYNNEWKIIQKFNCFIA